jgi:V/A-type H+-transporting ATPase subunit G/H
MEQKILAEIKKAEKEAGRIIEKAERKREGIILDARNQAEDNERREGERLKGEMGEKVRAFREKAVEEMGGVLQEKTAEMEKMRKGAEKNVAKAIESLKKEFYAFLGE